MNLTIKKQVLYHFNIFIELAQNIATRRIKTQEMLESSTKAKLKVAPTDLKGTLPGNWHGMFTVGFINDRFSQSLISIEMFSSFWKLQWKLLFAQMGLSEWAQKETSKVHVRGFSSVHNRDMGQSWNSHWNQNFPKLGVFRSWDLVQPWASLQLGFKHSPAVFVQCMGIRKWTD